MAQERSVVALDDADGVCGSSDVSDAGECECEWLDICEIWLTDVT